MMKPRSSDVTAGCLCKGMGGDRDPNHEKE